MISHLLRSAFWTYLNVRIRRIDRILQNFRYYRPSASIFTKAQYASEILDLSNQFGEGWMLAAEVAHLPGRGLPRLFAYNRSVVSPTISWRKGSKSG